MFFGFVNLLVQVSLVGLLVLAFVQPSLLMAGLLGAAIVCDRVFRAGFRCPQEPRCR